MKKTLLSIFMVIIMLISLVLPASAATGDLSATATLSEDGTSFTVELIVKNNPGIIALTSAVSYDSSVLKLKSAKNGEIFDKIFMPSQNLTVNPYKIIWMEATSEEDIKTNGVLATYTFEVLKTAAIGQTEIKFDIPEVVNFKKDNTANFKGCSFKVNVKGIVGGADSSNQATAPSESGTVSTDKITNEQTLEVQKPLTDNTDTESDITENSSVTETLSSDTESLNEDDGEEDVEGKDRTMITIITIGAVLLVGIIITLAALYFRKKSGNNTENKE